MPVVYSCMLRETLQRARDLVARSDARTLIFEPDPETCVGR